MKLLHFVKLIINTYLGGTPIIRWIQMQPYNLQKLNYVTCWFTKQYIPFLIYFYYYTRMKWRMCYAALAFPLFLATAKQIVQTYFQESCIHSILNYQGHRSSERHPQMSKWTPRQVDVLVRPKYIWMRHCHYSIHHDHLHSEQRVLILALEDFLWPTSRWKTAGCRAMPLWSQLRH